MSQLSKMSKVGASLRLGCKFSKGKPFYYIFSSIVVEQECYVVYMKCFCFSISRWHLVRTYLVYVALG